MVLVDLSEVVWFELFHVGLTFLVNYWHFV